jgi:transposase, IS30 family
MAHGRPGPAPQTAKREQFARLIARGVSNSEACRIVGINRRTGKRWRHGRTITSSSGKRLHYPAVVDTRKREISPRYLSEEERVRVADLRRAGLGVRAIAVEVGRSSSTISRELRRNRDPSSGQYRPFTAQRLAAERRARPRKGKLAQDLELRTFVQERLGQRWSPEQICHALRSEFPNDPERHVVHETIYQAVYRPDLGGLRREPPRVLRTGRRRRKPRSHPDARRAGALVDMTMIDQRPVEAADRTEPGHWEGDLITGANNRSAIGTLVERSTRFTILLHLPGRHTADDHVRRSAGTPRPRACYRWWSGLNRVSPLSPPSRNVKRSRSPRSWPTS